MRQLCSGRRHWAAVRPLGYALEQTPPSAGAVRLAASGAFTRPPAPIPRAPCYPGNDGLCLRCRAPHRPAAGPHETPSPKPSRALGKWLAKDGPRHYPLLAVEVRAARVVMSGPLPGSVCRRSLASSATSVSHDDDVIVCKSRLAVKE